MKIRLRLIPRSLKKQLLLFLLSSLLIAWGATAFVSYKLMRTETAELFNAELAQSARVLQAFVENMLQQHSLNKLWGRKAPDLFDMPILGHKYERKIAFQLRSVKEGVVLRSESAPEFALSLTRNGYSETELDGQLWHVFSISSENGEYVIHVGQRDDIRQQMVNSIASEQGISFLFALPILGVMIWLIVNRTLSPLNQLKRQLARREFGNLQALPAKRLPDELLPVVNQINSLFQQLEQAINNERNFTSDASHELKTPLAGLLTQMQVAQKTEDPAVRNLALQKAQQAVMRMTHMVQQLLILSRVQHDNTSISKQTLNLNEALVAVIADMDAVAYAKSIDLELQVPANLAMTANPQLLQILVRNLVDNAIKYSPNGSRVLLQARQVERHILISVDDSGNGVADDDYQRLTQRFYRCIETAASVEGSGLGLSIAQRIMNLHHAQISFSKSELGGLKALLSFPLNNNPINSADLSANMM